MFTVKNSIETQSGTYRQVVISHKNYQPADVRVREGHEYQVATEGDYVITTLHNKGRVKKILYKIIDGQRSIVSELSPRYHYFWKAFERNAHIRAFITNLNVKTLEPAKVPLVKAMAAACVSALVAGASFIQNATPLTGILT